MNLPTIPITKTTEALSEASAFLNTLLDCTTAEDAMDLLVNNGEDVSEKLIQAGQNVSELLTALKELMPYAQTECESLFDLKDDDGDQEGEALHAKIAKALSAIAKAEDQV